MSITPVEARERYSVGDPMLVCDSVADLIEAHPAQHEQSIWAWESTSCGTQACVAGWVGILHDDCHIKMFNEALVAEDNNTDTPYYAWIQRQVGRLGITAQAGDRLFGTADEDMTLMLLREISKFHANSGGELLDAAHLSDMQSTIYEREGMMWDGC